MNRSELVDHLRGRLVPALLTPMTEAGEVEPDAFERYAAAIGERGVSAVAVWAHTGRGPYLDREGRRSVLRSAVDAAGVPVIAGVGAPTGTAATRAAVVRGAMDAAAEAAAGGAEALMVFPPVALRHLPGREEAALELHRRIAELGLPILLFLLHGEAGGFPYSDGLLRELLSIPQTAGIKLATLDSAMTCQDVIALVRSEFPDRLAVTGEDRMYGPSLMWGADSALVGIAAAAPELSLRPLEAWRSGDAAGFLTASERLDRFATATFRAPIEGYVQRMLWAAAWEGLIPERLARDPHGPGLPAGERAAVERTLQELLHHAQAGS
ncbi:MAG TPA: dihydrodipicolinate synthase family protein [Candidatus Dormibacteraeota bacterium]|nr:dihydrodipicolinate synthase family protein [Candidatus Dormibacteraeota bacterium]